LTILSKSQAVNLTWRTQQRKTKTFQFERNDDGVRYTAVGGMKAGRSNGRNELPLPGSFSWQKLTLNKFYPLPVTAKKFIIRKLHTAYLVTLFGFEVTVEPHIDSLRTDTTTMIATAMQLIGNSKLQIHQPADAFSFMKNHYRDKGWVIEEME
jgi:hypothetical protein